LTSIIANSLDKVFVSPRLLFPRPPPPVFPLGTPSFGPKEPTPAPFRYPSYPHGLFPSLPLGRVSHFFFILLLLPLPSESSRFFALILPPFAFAFLHRLRESLHSNLNDIPVRGREHLAGTSLTSFSPHIRRSNEPTRVGPAP